MKSPAVRDPQQKTISGDASVKTALASPKPTAPEETAARPLLSNNRKPRLDQIPRVLQMPPEQIQLLKHWLTIEGASYVVCKKRLLEKFGVETSRSALSDFFHAHCVPATVEAEEQQKPLVDICVNAAGATVRIAVMGDGRVITTKEEPK